MPACIVPAMPDGLPCVTLWLVPDCPPLVLVVVWLFWLVALLLLPF